MLFKKIIAHRYELVAFLTGAAVMILEIVGARLIAPYFGTSVYVWTAMIGVILGSLAIGYAFGGKMADRDDTARTLPALILGAACLVLLLGFIQNPILAWLATFNMDLRVTTFIAAVVLFSPPSLLIGAVSPHLAKIRVTSLTTTGQSIGRLEAAGALGSIAGTFACGYVLLGLFGSRAIIIGVVFVLVIASLLTAPRNLLKLHLIIIGAAIVTSPIVLANVSPSVVADVDSSYARYMVVKQQYAGESITALRTDGESLQSAVSNSDPNKLAFPYIQQFAAALAAQPRAKSILVIGGGTFTFPAYAARQHPDLQVDAVEIDPALTDLAKRHFNLRDYANLRIINADGRAYLNQASQKYDMIFLDAYNSLNPPFQLTTREALQQADEHLTEEGVIVSNIIGDSDTYNDRYLQAMRATAASVFESVEVHPALTDIFGYSGAGNYILFAGKSPSAVSMLVEQLRSKPMPVNEAGIVLRDDFAPIEQLTR